MISLLVRDAILTELPFAKSATQRHLGVAVVAGISVSRQELLWRHPISLCRIGQLEYSVA